MRINSTKIDISIVNKAVVSVQMKFYIPSFQCGYRLEELVLNKKF